ncbi:alpha-amylase family glycosyl hydrolase [Blastococcus sp. BMG 814]|uniref:Alpha-amylase family glycosyl hydrolase n=1 Tax=Blastococcus carthaginiensis TaxID=3050034 RepID=A0ABT9I7M0_9ACTN|nr:alpha-amylase family glycosyl hydrolase [Blastococcus carthaginiensis]MDP5181566.1 alpha-amylase family glycosyl hydrolase [Blastococcus carthaginiensis]
MTARIDDLDWTAFRDRRFHPSPSSWADQVLYFLLVDRFSDGREDGYRDIDGNAVPGTTPMLSAADDGNAVGTAGDAAAWRAAGGSWVGGTLEGVRSKLGYLGRLGVTALWISPVLRQRAGTSDYHGYGTQDFLDVDPHYGTGEDLRRLVTEAHRAGMYVILDVVLNHTGDVFGYDADRYPEVDPDTGQEYLDPRWDGRPYRVAGWRDETGAPSLSFPDPVDPARRGSAVWPAELQRDGTFTCRGRISGWDHDPEFREGDFYGYKDVWHGTGPIDDYRPSAALQALVRAYQYWIAHADLDGFRIDTVKHMDPGATRFVTSAIHEFAQSIGKDSFFLVGEITGPRGFAVELSRATGLDAALGLADVQDRIERMVKGWAEPAEYFSLFRNSLLVGEGSHAWFRDHVVTSYDDHDQVRRGTDKARFAADADGRALAAAVIATNVTTLGIPCIYYGSEQCFDGRGGNDRYIREAMFGGGFGAFRSAGRHCFDEIGGVYPEVAALLAVRRQEVALRRGRQYLREISGDGVHFGLPRSGGERMTTVVAWSRILADREVVCAINTDPRSERNAWATVDAGLHRDGSGFTYLYHPTPGVSGTATSVETRNGRAVHISLPPAGVAVLGPS